MTNFEKADMEFLKALHKLFKVKHQIQENPCCILEDVGEIDEAFLKVLKKIDHLEIIEPDSAEKFVDALTINHDIEIAEKKLEELRSKRIDLLDIKPTRRGLESPAKHY